MQPLLRGYYGARACFESGHRNEFLVRPRSSPLGLRPVSRRPYSPWREESATGPGQGTTESQGKCKWPVKVLAGMGLPSFLPLYPPSHLPLLAGSSRYPSEEEIDSARKPHPWQSRPGNAPTGASRPSPRLLPCGRPPARWEEGAMGSGPRHGLNLILELQAQLLPSNLE